jgi:MFS family permease
MRVSAVPADNPERRPGIWSPGYRSLTAGLVLTITLSAVESLAVITILPLVKDDLGGLNLYGWVTSAFFLGTLVGIVAGGREADRRSARSVYLVGLSLFAAGLVIGGLAPSMLIVVLGRVVQGLGAGTVPAVTYAVIGRAYPERLRPRIFAILSTAWVVPGFVGPALSAIVAENVGWRFVFLGIVPLVAVAATLTGRALRSFAVPPHTGTVQHRLLDALRVAGGVGLVLAGLDSSNAIAALSLVISGAIVGIKPLQRLLPAGTLRARRGLPAAILTRGLLTFAYFGTDAFVPLTITAVRGQTAGTASIAITAATVCWTTGAWAQERLAARWTARRLLSVGLLLVVLGIVGVAIGLSSAVPLWEIVASWGVAGLGIGLGYSRLAVLVLSHASPGQEGQASASLQLADNLGVAFGAGVGGVALTLRTSTGWDIATALALAFGMTALVGAGGFLVALRLAPQTVPRD